MAPPTDAHDRQKVVVKKKKAPPIPVPSAEAVWYPPAPKPKPKVVKVTPTMMDRPKPKPKPHGGHLPTQFEYLRPEVFALGKEDMPEDALQAIKRYNQQRERARRDAAHARKAAEKAAREERREEIREARRKGLLTRLGQHGELSYKGRRPKDYIRYGPDMGPSALDIVGAVGKSAFEGMAGQAAAFTTRLRGGLAGRESGREISASDEPLLRHTGDIILGPNIMRAGRGESFDPYWLAAELGLLIVPVKGLPTPVTTALRALIGTQRLAAAGRQGKTVAEVIQELTRPVSEVRAARRLKIAGEAAADERRASSWIAEKLAGDREGRLATLIRNDPRTMRVFKEEDAFVESPAALSRIGKQAQRIIDKHRAGIKRVLPHVKDERTMYAQVLRDRVDTEGIALLAKKLDLAKSVPRNALHQVDWPAIYAARSVLKGVPLTDAIRTTERAMDEAIEAGETLKQVALNHHLAYYRAAEKYVTPEGALRPDAPPEIQNLIDAINETTTARETILQNLDLLDAETARNRVLKEQLYYHTGKLLPQDDEVAKALRANPIRKQAAKIFREQNPAMADHALTIWDANARRYYEDTRQLLQTKIDNLTESIEHDPNGSMVDPWRIQRARLEVELDNLKPDVYWDNVAGVHKELSPEILARESGIYGKFEEDWFFKLHEQTHPFHFPDEKVAENRKLRETVGELEWKNERQFASEDRKRLALLDQEVDTRLKLMIDKEYQTGKADYDLAAGTTKGKRGGARQLPKEVEPIRRRGGAVDIQRTGELARPVERTGKEYLGPARSGRDLAEDAVLRRLATEGDPLMAKINEAETLRLRVQEADLPAWARDPDAPLTAEQIPLVGEITFDEMLARLLIFSTPAQRERDAAWYHQIEEIFGAILNDREIMTWIATQRGQGPAGGVQELWKVLQIVERGEEIPSKGLSKAIVAMKAIMESDDPKLPMGARAKMSDFFDSALGRDTRTWMGDGDPEIYGHPMVIDRWSSRAQGVPESKDAVNLLRAMGVEAEFVPIGPAQYERLAKRYEDFVKFLNAKNFDGRADWTAAEVQAMDWYAVQRQWGREPRSLHEALDIQTYRADFEITQGPQNLGADMDPDDVRRMAESAIDDIRRLVDVPGARIRRIDVDTSGWAGGSNPSIHVELMGTDEVIHPLLTKIAQAFDQELVQASRWVTVNAGPNKSKAALRIFNPALADPAVKTDFFARLNARFPELGGYMPAPLGREQDGIVIRTTRSNLSNSKEKARWAGKYEAGIREIEQEMGLAPSRVDAQNLQLLIGSQHGIASAADEPGTVGGIRRLADLDPDAARIRRKLTRAIKRPDPRFSLTGEGGLTDDTVDALIGAKGDDLARVFGRPYEEAVEALSRQEVPTAFIELVNDSGLHIYDKMAIGRSLDRTARQYGGQKISGRGYPHIPGADEWLPDKLTMGGMWEAVSRNMYLSPQSHPSDYIHELMHVNETEGLFPPDLRAEMYKFVGADPFAKKLTNEQSEDLVDMFEAMILGFDPAASNLPAKLQKAFSEVQRAMKEDSKRGYGRAKRMLEKMPEDLRLRLEDTFWYEEMAGRAGTYVPEVPGLPFSFRETMLGVTRYPALYRRVRAGKRVTALTVTDKALEKQFTGALLHSGLWDRDITKGPMSGLIKAIEIQKMHRLRQGLLDTATDIPTSIYDVAVPLDPKTFSEEAKTELGSLFRLFDVMDSGAKVSEQELDRVTLQGIEQARDYFFPGMSNGTKHAIQDIADEVMRTQKPILDKNGEVAVRWVKRDMLEKVKLFEDPSLTTKYRGTTQGKALSTVDFLNNIAKNYTLSWNPAYYPMNMAGQGVMLVAQQGAFAPYSLIRSLFGMRDLGSDAHLIDLFSGSGLASIVSTEQRGALGRFTNASSKMSEVLIDRFPRRAAFLHEARRLGYKTNPQLRELMLNPRNFNDLYSVVRRTNKAMVDFHHLSRFEKEFVTRAIFVYPWLRGATRYALNFPLDHPIQAALFAGLLYWQQQRLQDAFPEGHPGYLKWYLPIKKGNEEENPYGFRMEQLFTPLQMLDLAAEITFWVAPGKWDMPWGSNEEGMATKLNPLYEEVLKTIQGWDSFTKQEVDTGLIDLFRRLADPRERWASWDRLKKVIDETTHEGIYDTTQFQNWLRLFLGSLAPINVDEQEAADRAAATKTITIADRTPEEKLEDWIQEATRLGGQAPPPDVIELKKADMTYSETYEEYKKEHEIDTGLTAQETVAVLALTWGKLHPERADEMARKAEQALNMSVEEAEAVIEEGREKMGLTRYGRIEDRMSEAREKERVNG